MMTRWMIVVSGPDKIDEFRRAADDFLSLHHATMEVIYYVRRHFGADCSV